MNVPFKLSFLAFFGCFVVALALAPSTVSADTYASPRNIPSSTAGDSIVLPQGFSDPIEPFNRGMWGLNKDLMTWGVRPFSMGYRHVVVKPLRDGIGHMGKNLTYPDRLANNLLEGRWLAAGQETERCLCNTILGVGGFFDVASRWGIPKKDADFGQTFRQWGCRPGFYLMLPLLGPSDARDGIGLAGDAAANPTFYFFPFDLISPSVTANNLSDTVDSTVRFSRVESDPYSILQYGWSFGHENRKVDMRVTGEQDQPSLQTLQAVFFSSTNAAFPNSGKTRSALIPPTGKELPFTYWLQRQKAPMVYLVPGIGAHRLADNVLGLAELLYRNGYSVACLSSTFHPEFMERASTTDLPSYPPGDVSDLRVALTAIDGRLDSMYPHRLGSRALMGYSMGAFQVLFMAAQVKTNETSSLKFNRYVAIDLPVDLRYAATNLDQFYRNPLSWPASERTADIENTLLKVVALNQQHVKPGSALPFNTIESKFLIALDLRLTLRDILFSSQMRHNQGVLQQPLRKSRRRAAYEEIMHYSFWDYITKFAIPYDKTKGIDMTNPETARKATDLRTYTDELQGSRNVRIIANRNDFLLSPDDRAWIETTFPPSQVRFFNQGGHLGNLSQPDVQKAIVDSLRGLPKDQTASETALRQKL